MIFKNRQEAGKLLSHKLIPYKTKPDALILGLPRGGVIVAFEVAQALELPLDIICPQKIGAPFNAELALGAITDTGEGFFNRELIDELELPKEYLEESIMRAKNEAREKLQRYRKKKEPIELKDKIVIICDDGLATGATMKASILSVKNKQAKKIVVAVPVGPMDTLNEIHKMADEVICLHSPALFYGVGEFYSDFSQTSDQQVLDCLTNNWKTTV